MIKTSIKFHVRLLSMVYRQFSTAQKVVVKKVPLLKYITLLTKLIYLFETLFWR